mmetsp:Transcript_20203/g.43543  ORF Transcript_20203/g.43543 Transcript_20203/m.43543 type:complete len:216 (-) Transcript_20203:505-1152(-)
MKSSSSASSSSWSAFVSTGGATVEALGEAFSGLTQASILTSPAGRAFNKARNSFLSSPATLDELILIISNPDFNFPAKIPSSLTVSTVMRCFNTLYVKPNLLSASALVAVAVTMFPFAIIRLKASETTMLTGPAGSALKTSRNPDLLYPLTLVPLMDMISCPFSSSVFPKIPSGLTDSTLILSLCTLYVKPSFESASGLVAVIGTISPLVAHLAE